MGREEVVYKVEQALLPEGERDCPKCKGNGVFRLRKGRHFQCKYCRGSGKYKDYADGTRPTNTSSLYREVGRPWAKIESK